MIPDLTSYGFSLISSNEQSKTYLIREGVWITVFSYQYKQANGVLSSHESFMISTKKKTWQAKPLAELDNVLGSIT